MRMWYKREVGNRNKCRPYFKTYANKSARGVNMTHKNKIRRDEQRKTIKKYSRSTMNDGQEDKSKTFALRPVCAFYSAKRKCAIFFLCTFVQAVVGVGFLFVSHRIASHRIELLLMFVHVSIEGFLYIGFCFPTLTIQCTFLVGEAT